jgi:hypothetical protein
MNPLKSDNPWMLYGMHVEALGDHKFIISCKHYPTGIPNASHRIIYFPTPSSRHTPGLPHQIDCSISVMYSFI